MRRLTKNSLNEFIEFNDSSQSSTDNPVKGFLLSDNLPSSKAEVVNGQRQSPVSLSKKSMSLWSRLRSSLSKFWRRITGRTSLTKPMPENNVEMVSLAFWTVLKLAGPVLIVALIVGLTIGIIQAATSINEMTLSFVPKVVIVILTIAIFTNYLLIGLSDYFMFIFDTVANLR